MEYDPRKLGHDRGRKRGRSEIEGAFEYLSFPLVFFCLSNRELAWNSIPACFRRIHLDFSKPYRHATSLVLRGRLQSLFRVLLSLIPSSFPSLETCSFSLLDHRYLPLEHAIPRGQWQYFSMAEEAGEGN